MRKTVLMLAAATALSAAGASSAEAGCYRLGLTGYHWYGSCFGPRILYPHRRICEYRRGGGRVCFYR